MADTPALLRGSWEKPGTGALLDLTLQTLRDIEDHARIEYPREACGLVVIDRGRQRYVRCRNAAAGTEEFVIVPADYARAEAIGEMVAVVHSHPDAPATPTAADRVACEGTGVPWFILSIRKADDASELEAGEWARCDPCGYIAPLVGRPFVHGILDCYSLIRDWYERERGVRLPDFDRRDDWWITGSDLYRRGFPVAGFRALEQDESVELGDVFLCQIRSKVPNHGGIWIGDGLVLHHLHGRLSSRDVWGGYLRENHTHWLRYVGHGPAQPAQPTEPEAA